MKVQAATGRLASIIVQKKLGSFRMKYNKRL